MQLTIIAAICVAIVGVFFAMQNDVPVAVSFMVWRFDGSLALVLLLAVAMGASIIALLTTPATLSRQWLITRQKRRIKELEKDSERQRARIVELEQNSAISESPPESSRPYVGLKEIVMSGNDDAGK